MSVTTFAAAQLLRVLPRVRLSRAVGRLCEAPLPPRLSQRLANVYAQAYKVNLGEAEPRDAAYPSFDAFFTRPLRDGARHISGADVVSPADGMLQCVGRVEPGARIVVKDRPYDVGELLGDAEEGRGFESGSFAIVYLSPRDYHRVHSPVDENIERIRGIPGDLYPVNAIGERVPRLLVRNNRVSISIDAGPLGRAAVVMVGAIIVGRISVRMLPGRAVSPGGHRMQPAVPVRRGDEFGTFHLGSTAVIFIERARLTRAPGPVRYGEPLLVERS